MTSEVPGTFDILNSHTWLSCLFGLFQSCPGLWAAHPTLWEWAVGHVGRDSQQWWELSYWQVRNNTWLCFLEKLFFGKWGKSEPSLVLLLAGLFPLIWKLLGPMRKTKKSALYFSKKKEIKNRVSPEPKPCGTKSLDKQLQTLTLIQFVTGQLILASPLWAFC